MAKGWLITGGSSGLGLALGRAVLQKGDTAVLTTRSIAKAQEAAPDVEKNGGKWLQLDQADAHAGQIVKEAIERWDLDVVVNNAAYAAVGAVEDFRFVETIRNSKACTDFSCSAEVIREQYEANLVGPIRITQAAIPIFRQRKSGTICNVGSSASYSGMPGNGIYGSTKSALRSKYIFEIPGLILSIEKFPAITESLTVELASFGIRVLLFEPGRFRTNFRSGAVFANPNGGFSEAYEGTPVDRVVSMLSNPPPSPGNPELAALRMYEIVTRTGMGADDKVKDLYRFGLGSDTYEIGSKAAKQWGNTADATKDISLSTDFKE